MAAQFVVPLIMGLISTGAQVGLSVGGMKKQERETKAANLLGYQTWSKEHELDQRKTELSERNALVSNFNNILAQDTKLKNRLINIYSRR